jgi:multimeric flavodoxin WrbA
MKSFLDRLFYVSASNGNFFQHKVGAAVTAVRRSGGVAALDTLNHYMLFAEMMIPGSSYWNVIHGRVPGESAQDGEGVHTMRTLGNNMAWLMKIVEAGKNTVPKPEKEEKVWTSFIR